MSIKYGRISDEALASAEQHHAAEDIDIARMVSEIRHLRADRDRLLRELGEARAQMDASRWGDEARQKACEALIADRNEWRTQHDNALACWDVDRKNLTAARDTAICQRDEARAEVTRLTSRSQGETICDAMDVAEHDTAERIAKWIERLGAAYNHDDLYRQEVVFIAAAIRSGAWREGE